MPRAGDNFTKRKNLAAMETWTTTDLLDVTGFQAELHKVTISPENKVDLISC